MKFKSAEAKRVHEDNERSWTALKTQYEKLSIAKNSTGSKQLVYTLSNPPGRERRSIPSLVTGGGNTAAKPSLMYSGSNMLGIGMLHKSNLVPVFKQEDAKDLASMRR